MRSSESALIIEVFLPVFEFLYTVDDHGQTMSSWKRNELAKRSRIMAAERNAKLNVASFNAHSEDTVIIDTILHGEAMAL